MKSLWIVRTPARLARLLLLLWVAAWLAPVSAGRAQDSTPSGPVYIVQPGDSLWSISQRFGVSIDDLRLANSMSETTVLKIGDRLVIPGLQGAQGVLSTQPIVF